MTAYALWRRDDAMYPALLRTMKGSPATLYALGQREILDAPCVAIVGTRRPTMYGQRVTTQLATALAQRGVCIVSGMATGVDGCAHRAALGVDGRTVAVLGAGIDDIYPSGHATLYRTIARDGLVVAEHGPGTKAFKGCFPRRNRIIAGLASVTIVVEAGHKSGALITADYAADCGRTVAAVPGPIDSEQSAGTNQLIRDGANVIASVDDAIMLLGLTASQPTSPRALSGDEAMVWEAIASATHPDTIIAKTGLSAERCMAAITNLEVHGLIECLLSGEIQRR